MRSPSWKRLSSASVPESIRELAKKYDSDTASLRGLTPPDAPTLAAPALGGADGEAATPVAARVGGEGRSPTLDPTPHHMLDGLMQRNDLYESPPPTQPLGSAAPPSQPPPTQPLAGDASPSPAAPLSPASAVASLLGPLLRATINDIEAEQAQQQPGERAHASAYLAARVRCCAWAKWYVAHTQCLPSVLLPLPQQRLPLPPALPSSTAFRPWTPPPLPAPPHPPVLRPPLMMACHATLTACPPRRQTL